MLEFRDSFAGLEKQTRIMLRARSVFGVGLLACGLMALACAQLFAAKTPAAGGWHAGQSDTVKTGGKKIFESQCAACHGLDGQNTGVPFAQRMSPPVPSLASKEVQGYGDGQLKWVIDYGIWPSGMPGSKGILSDDENWSIVVYMRNLPRAGSLGEPEMYSH